MARTRSFDGSFEDLPLSIQRAAQVDRGFHKHAACRNEVRGTPKVAWIAKPGRRYRVGANIYDGEKLVELALITCNTCPVQWECARVAIEAGEQAGVWADTLDNVRRLSREPDPFGILRMAKSTGVSVQRTVQIIREGPGLSY